MLCVVWEIYPPFLMQYIIYPLGEDQLVYVCTIILTGMHLSNSFLSCRNTPCQVEPRILQQQRSCGKKVRSSLTCNQMIHTYELILYNFYQRLSMFLVPWIPHEFFPILRLTPQSYLKSRTPKVQLMVTLKYA